MTANIQEQVQANDADEIAGHERQATGENGVPGTVLALLARCGGANRGDDHANNYYGSYSDNTCKYDEHRTSCSGKS